MSNNNTTCNSVPEHAIFNAHFSIKQLAGSPALKAKPQIILQLKTNCDLQKKYKNEKQYKPYLPL